MSGWLPSSAGIGYWWLLLACEEKKHALSRVVLHLIIRFASYDCYPTSVLQLSLEWYNLDLPSYSMSSCYYMQKLPQMLGGDACNRLAFWQAVIRLLFSRCFVADAYNDVICTTSTTVRTLHVRAAAFVEASPSLKHQSVRSDR